MITLIHVHEIHMNSNCNHGNRWYCIVYLKLWRLVFVVNIPRDVLRWEHDFQVIWKSKFNVKQVSGFVWLIQIQTILPLHLPLHLRAYWWWDYFTNQEASQDIAQTRLLDNLQLKIKSTLCVFIDNQNLSYILPTHTYDFRWKLQ